MRGDVRILAPHAAGGIPPKPHFFSRETVLSYAGKGFSAAPLRGGLGDARAQRGGGVAVGLGRRHVGALVGVGLGEGAREAAETVEVVHRATAVVVAGHHVHAGPEHHVLHGEHPEAVHGVLLVAVLAGGVGEAGGDLVFPGAHVPGAGAVLHELFEDRAGRAHVGRTAEDDGVGLHEGLPLRAVLLVLARTVEAAGLVQADLGALDGRGAAGDRLGLHLRVPVSAVVDDRDLGHGGELLAGWTGTLGPITC